MLHCVTRLSILDYTGSGPGYSDSGEFGHPEKGIINNDQKRIINDHQKGSSMMIKKGSSVMIKKYQLHNITTHAHRTN